MTTEQPGHQSSHDVEQPTGEPSFWSGSYGPSSYGGSPFQPAASLPPTLQVTSRGRRRRRVAILAASGALAVAALGGGVALATHAGQSTPTTAAGTTTDSSTGLTAGRGRPDASQLPGAAGGSSGSTDSNGYPSDLGYGDQYVPAAPGGSNGSSTGSGASGSTATQGGSRDAAPTVATAAQETGLVEITSTLTDGVAAGTGIILSSDGQVVTNHHVIAGATAIKVTVVSTGKTYTATYVGADSTADVAVLQLVDASGLTPATLATSGVNTGDAVTSVGDAGGDGGSLTAATGTVTAQNQNITAGEEDGTASRLTGLIEMAADIVPGDSGGAVYNASGQVVGMNVAASSGTRNVTGYAIPISTVTSVVAQIASGQATSTVSLGYDGYLGIGLASGTSTTVYGVVTGGPSASSGLAAGDTITSVGGTAVSTATQLRAAVSAHHPGDRVAVTWTTTSGATRSATITLGQAPIA